MTLNTYTAGKNIGYEGAIFSHSSEKHHLLQHMQVQLHIQLQEVRRVIFYLRSMISV